MHGKNKALFRKLALTIALPLAIANLSGCDAFQPVSDAEHVARAKDFQDKGDVRSGIIELKTALQKNPENPEARRLLGESYVQMDDGPAAEKELRKAIELGVAKAALVVPLSRALLLQGKNQELLDQITIPEDLDPTTKVVLLIYRGDAWLALNKADQSKHEYEEALKIDPTAPLANLGLARLALANKEVDRAKQLVTNAIESSPNEATLWSFQALIFEGANELEKAEESYTKAIDLRRTNQVDRANRSLVRLKLKKNEEAAKDIEILKKEAPNFYLTHYADGLLQISGSKWAEAQAALEQAVKLNDRYALAYYFLAISHLQQKHVEQAEQALARFMTAMPGSVKGHQAMALLMFQKKDYTAAKKYLEPVLAHSPDDVATLRLMADIDFAMGNSGEGLAHLKKAVELDPKSSSAQAQLGVGLLGAGEQERGLQALQSALDLNPNLTQAEVFIVLAHLKAKEFDKAHEVIDKIKDKMPDKALPLDLEGMAFFAKGEIEKSKMAFEKALELSPSDLTSASNLAQLAVREKNFSKARELLQIIVKDHPKHVPAYVSLAEISAREGKGEETESLLKQAIDAAPKSLPPRLILSRLYARFGQAQKAITLLEEVRADHGQNPDYLATLTEAQLERNQGTQALENAKRLVKLASDKPLSYYLLARSYAETGDAKNMRASLEKSLQLDPKFFRSRLTMVRLLTQEKKAVEAEKMLADLTKEFAENPEVLGLQGWFALQQRKPQEATKAYKVALEKFPSSSLAASLAQAQWAAGEKTLALGTLEKWNEQYPNDGYVRYLRAGLLISLGREADAKAQLMTILETQPDNVLVLNDLAWMLRKENPTQAQEYAEKAVSLAPKSGAFLDTLAVILLEKDQPERALSLSEQANTYAKNMPALRYHLAQAYARNGRKSEAVNVLKGLLDEKVSFAERKDAEELLKQLQ